MWIFSTWDFLFLKLKSSFFAFAKKRFLQKMRISISKIKSPMLKNSTIFNFLLISQLIRNVLQSNFLNLVSNMHIYLYKNIQSYTKKSGRKTGKSHLCALYWNGFCVVIWCFYTENDKSCQNWVQALLWYVFRLDLTQKNIFLIVNLVEIDKVCQILS